EGGGGLMAHAFRRRADGTLACRLDGEEKAIIAQVAQETADLIRADLGVDADGDVLRRAAQSEDPLRRLEAEVAGREARTPSDRLNSSHVSISYAVFCLIKKSDFDAVD